MFIFHGHIVIVKNYCLFWHYHRLLSNMQLPLDAAATLAFQQSNASSSLIHKRTTASSCQPFTERREYKNRTRFESTLDPPDKARYLYQFSASDSRSHSFRPESIDIESTSRGHNLLTWWPGLSIMANKFLRSHGSYANHNSLRY